MEPMNQTLAKPVWETPVLVDATVAQGTLASLGTTSDGAGSEFSLS